MAKVTFMLKSHKAKLTKELEEQKGQVPRLIFLIFQYGNHSFDSNGKKKYKYVKISTCENIMPKYWQGRPLYRARQTREFSEHGEFNARLDFLDSSIKTAYRRLINNGNANPTPVQIRHEYDKEIGKPKTREFLSFVGFVENYIKEIKALRADNTIKKYNGTLKHLKDYSESRKVTLGIEDINMRFYSDFHKYLVVEKKCSDNTFGKYVATIKGFIGAAGDRDQKISTDYKRKEFKVLKEDVEKIYLSKNEIDKIYKKDLTHDKKLERVRDVFVLDCYLGLRFSDITSLTTKNIRDVDGKKTIKIRTKKTGQDVSVPIHPYVSEILKKYKNEFPVVISNQKTNKYLKDIGDQAGINENLIVYKTIGGVKTKLEFKKFELITTHTARRSFATNAYKSGIPSIEIMKMTGHTTESSFLRYICITQEENATTLSNHPFFTQEEQNK